MNHNKYLASTEDLEDEDLFALIKAEKSRVGIYGNFIEGYNDFLDNGIEDIIVNAFTIEQEFPPDKKNNTQPDIEKFYFKVDFTNVRIVSPTIVDYNKSKKIPLYPYQARVQNLTYAGQIYIDATITLKAYNIDGTIKVKTHTKTNFPLAQMPIMTMCKYCNLYNKTREELINLKEDPNMYGGGFIINGVEWAVASIENTTFNVPRIFKQKNYKTESVRADLISKLGDGYENSATFKIIRHTDGRLECLITSILATDYVIPFYLLFRIFGASSDEEIENYITYGEKDTDTSIALNKMLHQAFTVKYKNFPSAINTRSLTVVMDMLVNEIFPQLRDNKDAVNIKDNTKKSFHYKVYKILDEKCMPHIGKTEDARPLKMKYLGNLIRKIFLTELGILESTDRDTYALKRLHGPGPSIAKAFKQHYNISVVRKIKTFFVTQMHKYDIDTIAIGDVFNNAINSADFEKSIAKAISSGTNSDVKIGSTSITNRLRTKQLAPKNHLHLTSIISNIETTSASAVQSGSERSEEMRAVHTSSTGYLCPIQSPVGGKQVGIVKQPAFTMYITQSTPGYLLENRILEDKDIIPYAQLPTTELKNHYPISLIYINGRPIAYTKVPEKLIDKYKTLRQKHEIDIMTTIYWNTNINEIEFWTDYGRVVRPLMKVYNNNDSIKYKESKKGGFTASTQFKQYVIFTHEHAVKLATNKITMFDLVREGVIEYISAEEQKNCLIAQSTQHLTQEQNPDRPPIKYTHCDIPQALLGIPIMTSPFGNHNYITKLILQGSQSRQTNGYIFNYPFRVDKSLHLQHYCDMPLVRTLAYDYTPPNGINVTIAMLVSNGYNQEDSLIVNKGAVERGLFDCSTFSYEKVELMRGDKIEKPDPTTTMDMKAYANYDKLLDKGYPPIGTIIEKNDVIIGRISTLQKNSEYKDKYYWVDNSVVYRENEPVIIEKIITDRDGNDQFFVKVKYRAYRPLNIGDKLSSREAQKSVIGLILRDAYMPVTKDGVKISLLMNAHSIITRKTMSQLIEMEVAKYCAMNGTVMDGTIFKDIDIDLIRKKIENEFKMDGNCTETLYNGKTGEPIGEAITVGICFYQRLQKFPIETVKATAKGPQDARVLQPISGKAGGGSIKEMEVNVLYAQGGCRYIEEKHSKHSDGMIDYYCRNCSTRAVTNHYHGVYYCVNCKDAINLTGVRTSWASKLMLQNMNGTGIHTELEFEPLVYTT